MTVTLLHYPSPSLRKKLPETPYSPEHRDLALAMLELMYDKNGLGLAAPQVGSDVRVFVLDIEWVNHRERLATSYVFFNPVLSWHSVQTTRCVEGCLSFPGGKAEISRFAEVSVDALDLDGKPFRLHAEGLLAACIQHEYDHLEGITLMERANYFDRQALKKVVRKNSRGI